MNGKQARRMRSFGRQAVQAGAPIDKRAARRAVTEMARARAADGTILYEAGVVEKGGRKYLAWKKRKKGKRDAE